MNNIYILNNTTKQYSSGGAGRAYSRKLASDIVAKVYISKNQCFKEKQGMFH